MGVASGPVLCVDDEPFIRMMLTEYLAELGFSPIEADSGEVAIDMLRANDVSLLITDIRMGGISGWEVAVQARARQPDLPIIYISGYPSHGVSVPGSIYLSKPFRRHQLESAVLQSLSHAEHDGINRSSEENPDRGIAGTS